MTNFSGLFLGSLFVYLTKRILIDFSSSCIICAEEEVSVLLQTLPLHTDLSISQAPSIEDAIADGDDDSSLKSLEKWSVALETNNILVCHGPVFKEAVNLGLVKLTDVNLLIFDECHRLVM